ncbi:MAG: 50S ribosomal protein L13 [Candidatus Heimdallarchaeota archaeon]|nr:50S ribosomal protein L13 [Candidatus Heimdallarchaeota archaeon]MCK4291085.1 50S ribosomal protein L13 [Candidatus Heimdallarchaeota archaeon]
MPNTVVDAEGAILGRLASKVAKRLLSGEIVDIVNVEKIVISGKPASVIKEYKAKLDIRSKYNPLRGPFHYRIPDRFVRRVIRGMLPYKRPKGKNAFHRLKCHISIPKEFEKAKLIKIPEADSTKLTVKRISVGELCKQLGWNYDPKLDPNYKE